MKENKQQTFDEFANIRKIGLAILALTALINIGTNIAFKNNLVEPRFIMPPSLCCTSIGLFVGTVFYFTGRLHGAKN